MGKFVEFLKEQNGEEPYKLIVFNHSGEMVRDIKDTGLGELIQLMNIGGYINMFLHQVV